MKVLGANMRTFAYTCSLLQQPTYYSLRLSACASSIHCHGEGKGEWRGGEGGGEGKGEGGSKSP